MTSIQVASESQILHYEFLELSLFESDEIEVVNITFVLDTKIPTPISVKGSPVIDQDCACEIG